MQSPHLNYQLMHTIVDIDDKLLAHAMAALNAFTATQAISVAMQQVVTKHAYQEILKLRGKLDWTDSRDAMDAVVKTKSVDEPVGLLPAPAEPLSTEEHCAPVCQSTNGKRL
jgi:Arc/MetJ family transcription regulator